MAASVNFTLRSLHLPERNEREIIGFVGDGIASLIERSLGADHQDMYGRAMDIFSRYYDDHMLERTKLYPGTREVLEYFKEKRKVIVTNKRRHFTARMAEALEITGYFDRIVGRDDLEFAKPDSRLLLSVMAMYAVDRQQTAVIGDGINDMILAKGAGAWSCAYLNGLTPREEPLRYQPDFVYESIYDLRAIFQ